MSSFAPAQRQQAYGKFGFYGAQGSGKTYAAKEVAIGLHEFCVRSGALKQDSPVFFVDSETGSDWVASNFEDAGIPLLVNKTKAFTQLVPAIQEVQKQKSILIIDSITHFWKELQESFMKKKKRTSLAFQDWAWLKAQWGKFTNAFVNSQCHIIMCGRAGFEYDYNENDAGKLELMKSGVKMKAEAETGYEPSLLIYLQRFQEMDGGKVGKTFRIAQVTKDRSDKIDGQIFRNMKFSDLEPHVSCLNVGGKHVGVKEEENSEGIVPVDKTRWKDIEVEREAVLDEIKCHLTKLFPSTKAADKMSKENMLEEFFGTRSWKRTQTMELGDLRNRYKKMTGTESKEAKELNKGAEELF